MVGAAESDLSRHSALVYTNGRSRGVWRFKHAVQGQHAASVSGLLRANDADILQPAPLTGLGMAMQPDFMVWRDLAEERLEVALADWSAPQIALHMVTPQARSARRGWRP